MEEKKVCTECEAREQKLEELTQEEADNVAGGHCMLTEGWLCDKCDYLGFNYGSTCENCGAPWS